jgi:hypothetical protein
MTTSTLASRHWIARNSGIFFLLALLSGLPVFAQAQHPARCISPHVLNSLPPDVLDATLASREAVNAQSIHPQTQARQRCHQYWRIPVVFHVIHNRSVDSINAFQINSAMQVLNEDYRKKMGTPGFGTGVDTQIEFYLARRDPVGAATTGITYTKDSIAYFTYSVSNDTLLKSKIKWPQNRYLNVWVVDTIMYGPSYLLGYAHFPSNGTNILDGVVIADQYVGRDTGTVKSSAPYHKGRTLTHEVGHYLGLYHPFDYVTFPCEGDSAANCATSGDFVCDVPPHANPHFGCPTFPQNTCTEFPKDTNDYIFNYMEYVDDSCMNMFSQGQSTRMQNVLDTDSFRLQMVSTQNLVACGIEYYGFPDAWVMPHPGGCVRDPLLLVNQSLGIGPFGTPTPDTQFWWSIPGGTPDTSNLMHPVISYNAPGTYNIILTVVNNNGFCILPMFINIAGPNIQVIADTVNFPDSTSFLTFVDEPGTWSWNFGDGTGDSASTSMDPRYMYPVPDTFVYTAVFTPEDTTHCTVRYTDTVVVLVPPLGATLNDFRAKYTGAHTNVLDWSTIYESKTSIFRVERSSDGIVFDLIGIEEAVGFGTSNHYTFADEEAHDGVNYYRLTWIDTEGQSGKSDIVEVDVPYRFSFEVAPNPVTDVVHLHIRFREPDKGLRVQIRDIMGRAVMQMEMEHVLTPELGLDLDLSGLRGGVYFVKLSDYQTGTSGGNYKLLKTRE